jgi:glycosyltransferase involved in cell wall biosynthesis
MGIVTPYAWFARVLGVDEIFYTDHWSRPEGTRLVRIVLWKRLVSRALSAPLSRVVSVSDFNRALLTALDIVPNERISRIYNAVDVSRTDGPVDGTELRARYGIPADRRLILQVSSIIPEKGVGDLLEAAKIVTAHDPSAHFMFVGEGAARAEYTGRAEALGLKDRVTFTGPILDPFEEGVFEAADVVCQASRWQEAFGWAIAEGMAFRKPVVATRVGGIPEIVEHGVTGYLAERGDARQIADYVLSLLRDPDMRQRMGAAGRAAVEEKFDLQKNVAKLIQLYGIS